MAEPSISLRILDALMQANAGNRERMIELRKIRSRTELCQVLGYPDEMRGVWTKRKAAE